jgi:hypothetical protein
MPNAQPCDRPGGKSCADLSQRGAALVGTVLTVLIMSMVGMASVNLAVEEINHTNMARDAAVARHLARAGADLVIQWFHDPAAVPPEFHRQVVAKRFTLPSGPSFFDALGQSQFDGTREHPDLLLDPARPADEELLDAASHGLFRGLTALGRILSLKIYAPSRPGLLGTVEVAVAAGAVTKSFSFDLAANAVPPLPSGVQLGTRDPSQLIDPPGLPWVHWADLRIKGAVTLPPVHTIPVTTLHGPVVGQSYAEMLHREDRWLEIKVGGQAVLPGPAEGQSQEPVPPNVQAEQDPVPGLPVDQWTYHGMKKQALKHGRYYAMDAGGLLYLDGEVGPGLGRSLDEVLKPAGGLPAHGLIFVDTLDQRPPGADNLATLSMGPDYFEGTVVVNAHLRLRPPGIGRSAQALSPPVVESDPVASRQPVLLHGLHINGVLSVAGNLQYEGSPRVYGAIIAGGKVSSESSGASPLELWYNHDLSFGLVQGLPVVFLAGPAHEIF